ncbi:MAG: methionine ABC transporter ATP-binding protein [Oscillospiraceae bacterium]|nr:methionine ABC transporter ATP-binding protein [Oscillospiraceae bacterium]
MYSVRNITKKFDDNQVLKGVTLEIEPNKTTVLIGPSGSGKTTLLRCINLLEIPDGGIVDIGGASYEFGKGKAPKVDAPALREIRKKTGMVFQNFQLFPHMNVLQNIMEGPLVVGKKDKEQCRQEAMELLKKVGLEEKKDAYPYELSGGQQQRIAIARALASDPEVLLCDEATSALDPQTTDSILKLLQKINRERGITVIIITHQMSVIEQICHRVAILDAGQVAEIGPVEEIFSNPQTPAGRRLVSPDVALPVSTWEGPMARIAFNGNMTEEPIIASLAMDKHIKVSILGADTRNVDGKAFGTMLISLPEDEDQRKTVMDYLNGWSGVTAEEVRESV